MENILDDDLVASVSTVDDLPLPDQLVKFPIKNNHEHYSWDRRPPRQQLCRSAYR